MTVFTRLAPIIAEHLGIENRTIEPTDKFDDLGADSLDGIELVMAVEEEFGVSLNDDELDGLLTVGDVVALVERIDPNLKEIA